MPSNLEFALLTRIIQDQDFHSCQKAKITEEYFTTPECREVYRFISETFHNFTTAGQVPSNALVSMRFPAFFFAPAFDPVPVLCAELKREKLRMDLLSLSNDIQIRAEKDPMAAMASLRAESIRLASMTDHGEDMTMSGSFQTLLDRYHMVQNAHGVIGIPYPWPVLNEATQGMQPGQFIVLYGRPKSMKSWVGIYMGIFAYLHARRRVLFYTREMPPLQVAQRAAAAIGKVDYTSYINGKLQPEVKDHLFGIIKDLLDDEKMHGGAGKRQPFFVITSDRGSTAEAGGVSWLQSKIRDLQPDLVIVDGMYLMKDDRSAQRSIDWRQIAHISQDLKLTAQQYDIPLIGITQANRNAQKTQGEDLTELAFSDSLGQDADAVFRVTKVENKETRLSELLLTAPGLREGKFEGIKVRGEPATSFDYLSTLIEHQEAHEKTDYANGGPKRGASFTKRPQQFMDPVIKS